MGDYTLNDLRVAVAEAISAAAHQGQTDKGGEPYYRHPWRVAQAVRPLFSDPGTRAQAVQVAFLHDVLEDTDISALDLVNVFNVDPRIVEMVEALSFRLYHDTETREDYYARLREHKYKTILLAVKKADMDDNLRPDRLASLPDTEQLRLIGKYAKGYKELGL